MSNQQAGAIWVRKTKKGDTMLSIKLGDKNYIAFKNNYHKEGDNRPNYNIIESEPYQNSPQEPQNAPQTSETHQTGELPQDDAEEANKAFQIAQDEEQ